MLYSSLLSLLAASEQYSLDGALLAPSQLYGINALLGLFATAVSAVLPLAPLASAAGWMLVVKS